MNSYKFSVSRSVSAQNVLHSNMLSGTSALWSPTGLSQSDHNSQVTLTMNMLTEASWDLEKCHIEQVNHM